MTAARRDPIGLMLDIADRFMSQAAELDARVAAAIDANASHDDIVALMNLAATDRLRALTAAQAAAPFCKPKLQAIEVSPASDETRSRFADRLAQLSDADCERYINGLNDGTLTIEQISAEISISG